LAHLDWIQGNQIQQPGDGAEVSEVVEIVGNASREDFWYYKLEVKRAGAAGDWSFVGGGEEAVENGLLALWDTAEYPAGEYQLRLMVVETTGNYGPYDEITVTLVKE
jgi:hypothetical protein